MPFSVLSELLAKAHLGDPRSISRLISLAENGSPEVPEITRALIGESGRARVVGVTGAPGVGKSTLLSAMTADLRESGQRVGVLAVDPSSPLSGGALLGDRFRMQEHVGDRGVFVRSLASRGHLGGLSVAIPHATRVLDALGFDVVLIETVGVGQSEVEIASHADTTLLVLAPGFGDGIQAAKAGILEVADVFAVNKADSEGADDVVRYVRTMQQDAGGGGVQGSWESPILKVVARRGEGVREALVAIADHQEWLINTGELVRRRIRRVAAEIEALALATVRERIASKAGITALAEIAKRVVASEMDPYEAAALLVTQRLGT